jgi:sugar O-acyltransferase (sialic acid O-acetyltransferase NeuD family)
MKRTLIVGAGGLGRQVAQWLRDINSVQPTYEIAGYLTFGDGPADPLAVPVAGAVETCQPQEGDVFVCALAHPEQKQQATCLLKSRGARFATVIHPSASIAEHCTIGEGAVIFPNVAICDNASMGNFVTVMFSGMGHDSKAGDFATICSGCEIAGHAEVGEGAYMDLGSIMVPHKKVGARAYVAPGSIVVRNVREGASVSGNPARASRGSEG